MAKERACLGVELLPVAAGEVTERKESFLTRQQCSVLIQTGLKLSGDEEFLECSIQ